jgi:hypothetical protein
MKSKSQNSPYRPTLVKGRLVEITDPAEIAALERRIRAAEKALAERDKAIAAHERSRKAKLRK